LISQRFIKAIFFAVLALGLVFSGLEAQSQDDNVLRVGITQQIINLDPHVATAFSSFRVMEQVYEGLMRFDSDSALQPALAESFDVSDDGLTYTFNLRSGVTFHDGSAFTANDVKFSFERVLNPDTASPQASRINSIGSIDVISDTQVSFTLSEAFSPFLSALPQIFIVPQDFESKVSDSQVATLGTGPFQLDELGPDFARLSKNESYWEAGLPKLDGVLIRQIPEAATLRSALRTGQIDVIFGFGVDVISAGSFAGVSGFNVISTPGLSYSLLGIQNDREPFTDVRVRQALSLAIDRQELAEIVYFGRAVVAAPLAASVTEFGPLASGQLANYERDIPAAQALLADAGQSDLTFTISPLPTVPEAVQIAEVLQQQFEQAGITTELELLDIATWVDNWRNSNFDTFVSLNGGNPDPDIHLNRHLVTGGSTNVFQFSDPEVDALLASGRLVSGLSDRVDIYNLLQQRIASQVPFLFLNYAEVFAVMSADVQDFGLRADQSIASIRGVSLNR